MVYTSKNKFVQSLLKNLLAWFAAALVLIPVALILLNAFKGDGETLSMSFALPKTWQFSNFATVIEKGKLVRSFLNSMLYAGCATLVTVCFGSMAAYIFSRRRTGGTRMNSFSRTRADGCKRIHLRCRPQNACAG